jgi:dephospho-CoA kinase
MTKTKKKVGITGGIGAGKTLVSSILSKIGYPIFNSDLQAKLIVEQDPDVKIQIINLFGSSAYTSSITYNRKYISEIVFQEPEKLIQLNNIIHPKVREKFNKFVQSSSSDLVFNEAAILYETGAYTNFDSIILVTAPKETRIQRCMLRDELSREGVISKMNHQWSDDEKKEYNPFIIINDGIEPLLIQIEKIINDLSHTKRMLVNREDIEFMVKSFYSKVLDDEILSPFFHKIDFQNHLPKMIDFWCFVLIGTTGYTTNVIEKHLHMPLKPEHFDRWLQIFNLNLDANFEGKNVEIAKQRAFTIAWTTKSKMHLI